MKKNISKAARLKRAAKYAAYKITGREFLKMSKAARRAGLWWAIAFFLLGSIDLDNSSTAANIVLFSNFFAASGMLIYQQQKDGARG